MPATQFLAPPGVDTTFPGVARRRFWAAPVVRSHALVGLTLSKLYLAPAGTAFKPDALGALQSCFDLDEAFGPLATVIDLAAVVRITADLTRNSLTLEYHRQAAAYGTASTGPTVRLTIACADFTTSDEIYSKLWRRLSDAMELLPHRRDGWELVRAPVAFLGGVLLATLTLSLLANSLADAAQPNMPSALAPFANADWRWICGLGGAVIAMLQVWLYRRLVRPPHRLELVRKADPVLRHGKFIS